MRLNAAAEHSPERADQQGLAQAGDALDQDVTVGQEGDHDAADQVVLTDEDLVHLGQDPRGPVRRPARRSGASGSAAGAPESCRGRRGADGRVVEELDIVAQVMSGGLNVRGGEPGPIGPRRGRDDAIGDTTSSKNRAVSARPVLASRTPRASGWADGPLDPGRRLGHEVGPA